MSETRTVSPTLEEAVFAGHFEFGARDGGSMWHVGLRRPDCDRCKSAILAAAKEHGLIIGEGALDAAWREAEEALPEPEPGLRRGVHKLGGQVTLNRRVIARGRNDLYAARAYSRGSALLATAAGPTPTVALKELTRQLRDSRR